MSVHAEIYDGTQVSSGRRKPSDLVAEYEAKIAGVAAALASWSEAEAAIRRASVIGGSYPGFDLRTGHITEDMMRKSLLQSAWRNCWSTYGLSDIATAEAKRRIERMFEAPPPFTIDAIREQFGDMFLDPWASILRGLAEVFSSLDPAFKSHEKVKVGVKGLPKRVIISNVAGYGSYGRDRLRDILNALAAYQRKPLVEYAEVSAILEDGDALREAWTSPKSYHSPEVTFPARGVWLKRFANGNGHLFFDQEALLDINRALAEYYGDVPPDAHEYSPEKRASTEVAKDLQFYPTPKAVVDRLLDLDSWSGKKVLEPSCGDGAILDGLRALGADAFGIEVDGGRAQEARAKGHAVLCANFLGQPASPDFDAVVMNPPFYGRHYAKHVRHALKFLRPRGILYAILPATARHDHKELDDLRPQWRDLPAGSFAESGTRINTCIAEILA